MTRAADCSILGISAFFHDSAASLVVDGKIVAAAQEERFSRRKHDERFPEHASRWCLEEAGLSAETLDAVVFYEKPLQKFDRLLETYLAIAPRGLPSFFKAIPAWLKDKLFIERRMRERLPGFRGKFLYCSHHESHAASAFFPSPFEDAAILTVDGVGEWATATIAAGSENRITMLREMRFPHSVGLLYSAFTYFCGFKVNAGEYKLMGLAPYGEPRFADVIREKVVRIFDDGSIWMNPEYFSYLGGLRMTSRQFSALFGGPPRDRESGISQREMDLAASIQSVTEDIILRMARYAHAITGKDRLCLAGGVALNCVANGRLLREGPFRDIWVQPAAGDAGGSLGAALHVWHHVLGHPRSADGITDSMQGALLGPVEKPDETEQRLRAAGAVWHRLDDEPLLERVAELIAQGNVVGWVDARMEFGPRALGSRSILGDARSESMQTQMNVKIKFRESFRPFAPAVLAEHAPEWFDFSHRSSSPYMLMVAPVAPHRLVPHQRKGGGLDQVKERRSEIPAVTHVDNSARLQTVSGSGRFRQLLEAFARRTGCPVLINTSFNIRGEPIVRTAEEAYRCFLSTDMDALVVGNCLLLKSDNASASADARARYVSSFELD